MVFENEVHLIAVVLHRTDFNPHRRGSHCSRPGTMTAGHGRDCRQAWASPVHHVISPSSLESRSTSMLALDEKVAVSHVQQHELHC